MKCTWLVVVILGFSLAALLISQARQDWSSNPITTTITTLPISHLIFPNVSVCPPRKSFTHLNVDIANSANILLTERERKKLSGAVEQQVYASNLETKLYRWKLIEEEDQYQAWYLGLSRVQLPTERQRGDRLSLTYRVHSSAGEGSVASPYFQQPWDEDRFYPDLRQSQNLEAKRLSVK